MEGNNVTHFWFDETKWSCLANVVRFLFQTMSEKFIEQTTEKVMHDVAQKMKRDMAKSVDPVEVIDLSMVDDEDVKK